MNKFIPIVGQKGHYRLAQPFELGPNDLFTCKSIRTISERTESGEDVFDLVYAPKNISVDTFEEHVAVDVEIISLMSDEGYWVHVPSVYMLGYPNMNGVPYRTSSIVVALPAFPVDQDFSAVTQDIQTIVESSLGVTPVVTEVATSKTQLMETDAHTRTRNERIARSQGSTLYSQMVHWRRAYESLLIKHEELLNQANFS